ncbi:MAG: hypothetical protein ACOVKV_06745, partial [Novosphingobium sp.]
VVKRTDSVVNCHAERHIKKPLYVSIDITGALYQLLELEASRRNEGLRCHRAPDRTTRRDARACHHRALQMNRVKERYPMKKYASLAIVAAAALGLSACGRSDDASEAASEDTVEMPADELPMAEPSAEAAPLPATEASAAADAQVDPVRDAANNAAAVAAAAQAANAEEGEEQPAQ